MASKKLRKVIWAVDPFARDHRSQLNALRTIQLMLHGQSVSIEPVYLAYSFSFYPTSAAQLQMRKESEQEAIRLFGKMIKGIPSARLLPFRIVRGGVTSYRDSARRFLSYAQESKASLIVLSTHAREGVSRWFIGSFAESLMVESPIPLVVTNPHWKPSKAIKNILFATDFSRESRVAFESVLEFSKSIGLPVTLYYKFPELFATTMKYPVGPHAFYDDTFTREFAVKSRMGEHWIKIAKDRGVKAELFVDKRLDNSTAKSIVKHSTKDHSLVALASEETFLSRVLLGGTVRKVLRSSRYPIWIVRPIHPMKPAHHLFRKTKSGPVLHA